MPINVRITAAAMLVLTVSSLALANNAVAQGGKTQSEGEVTHRRSAEQAHHAGSLSNYGPKDLRPPPAAVPCPVLEGYPDCH